MVIDIILPPIGRRYIFSHDIHRMKTTNVAKKTYKPSHNGQKYAQLSSILGEL